MTNLRLLFALLLLVSISAPVTGVADQPVDFARDIQPLLSEHCFKCHGPDKEHRQGDLRLDTEQGILGEGASGEIAVVEGKPEESELLRRVTSTEKFERMPPPDVDKGLSDEEVALVRRWIEQGAQWKRHWSFVPLEHPEVPEVKQTDWARNAIDRFVLARLEAEGLSPSPETDRRTLIRRATLDLTGLPPTIEEVEAFLADESPDAYEKVVDRLLASPRYGEHMAHYWLDVARFGDTHGLHLDNYREMWPYRDWVVKAFNENKPFDQFITEQLAGDLLPDATLEQQVASGFNRCHVTTNEGGSIKQEVFVRNVVDRVETTGTVFLGLTVGCAVCHDHKYDPLTMQDFYSLSAFFNSLDGNPMDGNKKDPAPVLRVPTDQQKQELAQFEKEIEQVNGQIASALAKIEYREPPKDHEPKQPEPEEIVWIEDDLPAGANAQGDSPWKFVEKGTGPVYSGTRSTTRTADALSQHFFTGASQPLTIAKGDKLFAYVYLDPKNPPKEIMLQWNDGGWEHRAYWGEDLVPFGNIGSNSPGHRRLGDLPETGKWLRLEVEAAEVGLAPGAKLNGWAFTQWGGTVWWDKAGIVRTSEAAKTFHSLAAWTEHLEKQKPKNLDSKLAAVVKKPREKRSEADKRTLREHFLEHVYPGTRKMFKPLHIERANLEKQIKKVENAIPTTLVYKETNKPREAHVLIRGQYDQPGEKVTRRTPTALPPMPEDFPRNRLGLAKWLTLPDHPLTSRVAVNRFWQRTFGVGMVKTSEDFGAQGERPSHPGLLDWLAADFIDSGWNVKRFMKQMVMSATYRQSSQVTPELYDRDPENRLLARGPRFRLDAEVLRDQALAVGNLLNRKMGGPSVKPPQPKGLWFAVGYSGSNTVRFKPDTGDDKVHRRSLYTFWKRTAPPPQMSTFDAPSRESCRVRRERTNTPLQALLLLNDPQYVEAARALAERAILEGGQTREQRASFAFTLATARPPEKEELKTLLDVYQTSHDEYVSKPDEAKKLIEVGEAPRKESVDPAELAAWSVVANLILNLDEVIMKN